MNSSEVTRTYENIVQGKREFQQDPDLLEGMEYGFRDAGDEFGGEADYTIEGRVTWDSLGARRQPALGAGGGLGDGLLVDPPGPRQ